MLYHVHFLVCVLFYARCGRSAPAAGAPRPRVRYLATLGAGPSGLLRAHRARYRRIYSYSINCAPCQFFFIFSMC